MTATITEIEVLDRFGASIAREHRRIVEKMHAEIGGEQ